MQSPLFSQSTFMSLTTRLGELIILNLCYLLCCLPIVTIGPATAALYTVCFRFGTPKEKGVFGSFFRAFRDNFKQGLLPGLILLALTIFAVYFALVFYLRAGLIHYAFIPFLVLLAVILIVSALTFPLISLFENTTGTTLKNALLLGLGYLPRSLAAAVVNVLPLLMMLFFPDLFLRVGVIWFFLYFAAAAYLNTYILRPIFTPFLPKEEEDAEE